MRKGKGVNLAASVHDFVSCKLVLDFVGSNIDFWDLDTRLEKRELRIRFTVKKW